MATAFAALVSLINTIAMERTSSPVHPPIPYDGSLVDALLERAEFLVEFLERGWKGGEHLEGRIIDLAYAAEDAIESPIVDTIHSGWASSSKPKPPRQPIPTCHQTLVGNKKKNTFTRFLDQCWNGVDYLEGRTTDSTFAIKDATEESPADDTVLSGQDLVEIIDGLDSIKAEIMQMKDDGVDMEVHPGSSGFVNGPSCALRGEKNKMVGFEEEMTRIMQELEGTESSRQIISIVGMGGIGKTTLARAIYDHQSIAKHFDACVWVTVSQDYNAKKIFKKLLYGLNTSWRKKMDEELLGRRVRRSLRGRRYLVMLDDMCDVGAWDKIRRYFPDDKNGSRIILTTRLSNLADEISTCSFDKKCLDEGSSWKLFCEKVFGQGSCPPELEEVGKQIARNCRGLPLAIVVVGGLLSKSSNQTFDYWKGFAQDFNSNLNDEDHCSRILSLSYNHLPIHLKPCFLYLGMFPEDYLVLVRNLTNLWIAEGFLKSHRGKIFEETAEEYLKDLIERNLVMVHRDFNGKVTYCKLHALLRDLCVNEARRDGFFCVVTKNSPRVPLSLCHQRCLVVQLNKWEVDLPFKYCLPTTSPVRTLILNFHEEYIEFYESHMKLLKILFVIDGSHIGNRKRKAASSYVNLRYFTSHCDWSRSSKFVSNTCLLRNMQMLKFGSFAGCGQQRVNIWNWPQVRHIEFWGFHPLELPPSQQDNCIILENLQTIDGSSDVQFNEEVCKRIPNVKKLSLVYDHPICRFMMHNLAQFQNLESIYLRFLGSAPEFCCTQHELYCQLLIIAFPHSLRELHLLKSKSSWEDMSVIGSLPKLEVLYLFDCSFTGQEWNPVKGEFLHLQYLQIHAIKDLMHWNADHTHFPLLKKLSLRRLPKLKEIPLDVGKIPSLQLIKLAYCRTSVVMSAKKMIDEQRSHGDDTLEVEAFCFRSNLLDGLEKEEKFHIREIDSDESSNEKEMSDFLDSGEEDEGREYTRDIYDEVESEYSE